MLKEIPGYENYKISNSGDVYNSDGHLLKTVEFKNTIYVRLYKEGKRHTVSVNKLLFDQFNLVDKHLPLMENEVGIRYENSHYFLTNKSRCYNAKRRTFLSPVIRNGYTSYTIYINSKKKVVYPFNFLKKYFSLEREAS